jgi:hypothetical protein
MKKLLLFLLFALSLNAQTNLQSQGGIISSSGKILSVPSSLITSIVQNDTLTTGNLGAVNLVMPAFASGNLQDGGTFAAGGLVVVTAPDFEIAFVGTFAAGAQWTLVTLANGTHYYVLQNAILIGGNGGALVLQTSTMAGFWNQHSAIISISIVLD